VKRRVPLRLRRRVGRARVGKNELSAERSGAKGSWILTRLEELGLEKIRKVGSQGYDAWSGAACA
jgi:hypothetical protein